jgi:hypothetical protein
MSVSVGPNWVELLRVYLTTEHSFCEIIYLNNIQVNEQSRRIYV